MIKIIALFFPLFLFALTNPYENISVNEKINILVNSFVNEELKSQIPSPPIKDKLKDDSPIVRIQYELHFSYIQRFKAITQEREKELKKIEEKYIGDIGFYNGKLKTLKHFYEQDENINPLIQNSINKTYKIIYGKPKIKDVIFDQKDSKVKATVYAEDIYGFNKWKEQRIFIDIPQELVNTFVDKYREAFAKIAFKYKEDILSIDFVEILFQENSYKGSFIGDINGKIKLNIKINDDIFQPIKLGDE